MSQDVEDNNLEPFTEGTGEEIRDLLTSIDSALQVSLTLSPSVFSDFGANVTANVKASQANLYSVICYNANILPRYLQLHNTATTPSPAAVPKYTFLVPPGGQIGIGVDIFTDKGVNFPAGIAFAFSTTRNTYSAAAAADQTTHVHYI